MLWTKSFIPTLKETPQEAESTGHKLLLRAGLARMLMAGVYSYLPLGLKVLRNIENIIRQEMNAAAAGELLLPALQPMELWQRTGRDKTVGDVMIRFRDRRGRNLGLGPTHEEVITDLVKNHISSYKQLPLVLYQIQTKFRDEIRPRFGLVRSCEFIMKDAYSFDRDEAGLDKNYQVMFEAYKRIFKRCGLDFLIVEADSGVMGGKVSHEFMVPAGEGEDTVLLCSACKATSAFKEDSPVVCKACAGEVKKINAIEVGHVFKLGTKYSSLLGANYLDDKGTLQPIIMGCYGIGVSRLISTIIEQNHDDAGIIFPAQVSPFRAIILALEASDTTIMEKAKAIYEGLMRRGADVLLDDRDERAGVKFKDAELIGIPVIVVVGKKSRDEQKIEIKLRRDKKTIMADIGDIEAGIEAIIRHL